MDCPKLKYCKSCDKLLKVSTFYKAGKYYQSKCIPCHNARRTENYKLQRLINKEVKIDKPRKKILNIFQKMPDEKQDELLKYLGTMPLTHLARRMEINPYTLRTLKNRGHLHK
jgi:hypothetical protein